MTHDRVCEADLGQDFGNRTRYRGYYFPLFVALKNNQPNLVPARITRRESHRRATFNPSSPVVQSSSSGFEGRGGSALPSSSKSPERVEEVEIVGFGCGRAPRDEDSLNSLPRIRAAGWARNSVLTLANNSSMPTLPVHFRPRVSLEIVGTEWMPYGLDGRPFHLDFERVPPDATERREFQCSATLESYLVEFFHDIRPKLHLPSLEGSPDICALFASHKSNNHGEMIRNMLAFRDRVMQAMVACAGTLPADATAQVVLGGGFGSPDEEILAAMRLAAAVIMSMRDELIELKVWVIGRPMVKIWRSDTRSCMMPFLSWDRAASLLSQAQDAHRFHLPTDYISKLQAHAKRGESFSSPRVDAAASYSFGTIPWRRVDSQNVVSLHTFDTMAAKPRTLSLSPIEGNQRGRLARFRPPRILTLTRRRPNSFGRDTRLAQTNEDLLLCNYNATAPPLLPLNTINYRTYNAIAVESESREDHPTLLSLIRQGSVKYIACIPTGVSMWSGWCLKFVVLILLLLGGWLAVRRERERFEGEGLVLTYEASFIYTAAKTFEKITNDLGCAYLILDWSGRSDGSRGREQAFEDAER
ncbi:hypothetical protein B0H16DRAFT_1446287 [Mycena metata]|uniref:Uncharacterized protein n=1 Tax=Mycena metata TaxID=1033252 RepID=A0AAD7P3E7_9AGAR|nr:hypothetical protein B0H16DRAFT_1446287 [Mycena metata]